MRAGNVKIENLPFLKRQAFEDESEFRIIYESRKKRAKLDVPITLSCIDKITLSPWIDPDMFAEIEGVIKSIDGCRGLHIGHTSLINSKTWKKFGKQAT